MEADASPGARCIHGPGRLLLMALALGVCTDQLFYDRPLGISVLLFAGLLLCTLFGLGRKEGVLPIRGSLWLLSPLLFFAGAVFVRASPFLTLLNLLATMLLLGLIAHFYAAGRWERLSLKGYLGIPLGVGGSALFLAAPLVSASVDLKAAREQGGRSLLPIVRGILLALPILLLFAYLLASADLVFARCLEDWSKFQVSAASEQLFWRAILVAGASWFLAGGLAYALRRSATAAETAATVSAPPGVLGFVETSTVLVLINLLFLLFVRIQFAYLFGGQANVTGGPFTYAAYARRGFFELVAVSVLTLLLILGLQRISRRDTAGQIRAFKLLSTLMVTLVMVLLASALQRLHFYESAYGYTDLRLYVHVFMIWLAIVFGWFLVTLWLRPSLFAAGCFLAALGFVAALDILNPDAYIARRNLTHAYVRHEPDSGYLCDLSEDATPVLLAGLGQVRDPALGHCLRCELTRMESENRWRSWPSFHLSRWQAYRALSVNRARLQSYP